jgi:hypothetical protein
MVQRIEVPGMGIVEFPDGMADNDIAAAIQRSMPREAGPDQFAPNLKQEYGPLDSAMIGAGKTTTRIGQGLRQMYHGAMGNDKELAALKSEVDEENRLYDPLQKARPIATGVGEALPMLAVPVGGAGAGAMIGRGALAAAAPEALSYGSLKDRAKRAGVAGAGGALGGAVGLGVTRMLKPAGTAVQGVSDDALAAAERIGYKPTAGQVTGNRGLQQFENYLASSIGSGGRMARHAQGNQTAINRAASKAMGETADDLGEGVMGAAKARIGQEFERLQQITGPDMARPEFMQALIAVDASNVARGPYASAKIAQEVDKALDLAALGKISGKAYKEIHTELAGASTAAFKGGDATLGQAIKTIRESMDDAAKASLSGADQKAWDTVRRQWEAYKVLVKGNVAEAGDVSAARVASKLRGDPRFRTGQLSGELADVARVGEAFKGVQNPNSGQLSKDQINTLFGALRAGGDATAAAAYMSRPMQGYLTNGLPVGPNSRYMLSRGGGLLGVPGAFGYLGAE